MLSSMLSSISPCWCTSIAMSTNSWYTWFTLCTYSLILYSPYLLQLLDVAELVLDVRHRVLQLRARLPVQLLLQQLLRSLPTMLPPPSLPTGRCRCPRSARRSDCCPGTSSADWSSASTPVWTPFALVAMSLIHPIPSFEAHPAYSTSYESQARSAPSPYSNPRPQISTSLCPSVAASTDCFTRLSDPALSIFLKHTLNPTNTFFLLRSGSMRILLLQFDHSFVIILDALK